MKKFWILVQQRIWRTDLPDRQIMRNIKKSLFIAMVACLVLTCPSLAENPARHPLDAHLSKAYTEDLPGLLKRKYIRVLTTMNRTNFFLVGARPRGFEYKLLKEYEKFLNRNVKPGELKTTLEFIPVSRERLLPCLREGLGDIAAAGLTITEKRKEVVSFTRPYLTDIKELLVIYKDVNPPGNLNALSGKEIFVRRSSSYYESLMTLNRRLEHANLPPVKIVEADENLETEDILELINTGAIKRTVCDSDIAGIWAEVLHDIRVHEKTVFLRGGRIAWAVRKDTPKLKENLDRFLKNYRKGTLLGNILFKRYYENTRWIENPLKGSLSGNVDKYRRYFEKYGHQYDFDWRLILAMAYQESGLNQKKKSNRGAVGIMQILPATAEDPNVGIEDVDKLENNIHAAVKYLAFLRGRYFSDESIRPGDRVRFSLAAYNAGPANILRARKKAVAMNLDPNRWFRNLELAVLRTVSRETVQYVSNINKYYVIYKNALGKETARGTVKPVNF